MSSRSSIQTGWVVFGCHQVDVIKPRRTGEGAGHKRKGHILTPEQVKEILHRRERLGQSVGKIALDLGMPKHRVHGVIYGGCGSRTLGL